MIRLPHYSLPEGEEILRMIGLKEGDAYDVGLCDHYRF